MMRARALLLVACLALVGFCVKLPELTPYRFPVLEYFPPLPVNKSNPVSVEGASLGRMLFYDPILSRDSTMSCGSCHRQSSAFADAVQFSKGIDGVPQKRNTPPLFNLGWYPALFWDGRAGSLEQQVFFPVRDHGEMDLDWSVAAKRIGNSKLYRARFTAVYGSVVVDSTHIASAIGQFEQTLISYRSKFDKAISGHAFLTKDERAGYELVNDMTKGGCMHCHTTDGDALGTTAQFSNNGLDNVADPLKYADAGLGAVNQQIGDYGKFRIPSIRNLAFTAPYMHDGRFATLEQVMEFYSTGVNNCVNIDSKMEFARQHGARLSNLEKKQIISFLLTLTDSAFVADTAFSNPFKAQRH